MPEPITAYALKLKSNVEVENAEVYQANNGTWMLKGNAKGHPDVKVSKILGKNEEKVNQVKAQIGAA